MKPTHNLYFRYATTLWLLISCLLLASCVQKPAKVSEAERKAQDSIVSSVSRLDSLVALQKRMEHEGNLLGSIVAYRELGKIEQSLQMLSKQEQLEHWSRKLRSATAAR